MPGLLIRIDAKRLFNETLGRTRGITVSGLVEIEVDSSVPYQDKIVEAVEVLERRMAYAINDICQERHD